MMRCLKLAITVFCLGFLSACELLPTAGTPSPVAAPAPGNVSSTPKPNRKPIGHDYGTAPADDGREVIEHYMEKILNDPNSVNYRFVNPPIRGTYGGWLDMPVSYGYVMCVWINAKNSFGGYTGEQLYFFLIKNDEVVRSHSNANWLCKQIM